MNGLWVCPRCYRLHAVCGDHRRHLIGSQACMAATVSSDRRSQGQCVCTSGTEFRCHYRKGK